MEPEPIPLLEQLPHPRFEDHSESIPGKKYQILSNKLIFKLLHITLKLIL